MQLAEQQKATINNFPECQACLIDHETKFVDRGLLTKISHAQFVGGPEKWLAGWECLMAECVRWYPEAAYQQAWTTDFNLIWGLVAGAQAVCQEMIRDNDCEVVPSWTRQKAARELRRAWNDLTIRNGMRDGAKGRASRSTFHTETEPTYE